MKSNKIQNLFFSNKLNFRQRLFFIICAGVIIIQSLLNVYPKPQYFDIFSENFALPTIWAYANDIDFNYTPFCSSVITYAHKSNRILFDPNKKGEEVEKIIQEEKNKIHFWHYESQYRFETHLAAAVIKFIRIKKLEDIKKVVYSLFLGFSLITILLLLLYFYNQNGSIIPLIIAVVIWPFLKTDFNLWWNFGFNVMPLVLYAIYLDNLLKHQQLYNLNSGIGALLAFMLISLHGYDHMFIHAVTIIGIYLVFVSQQYKRITWQILLKKILPKTSLIGVFVLLGLLSTVLIHLQVVRVESFIGNATKRSFNFTGEQASTFLNDYLKNNKLPTTIQVLNYAIKPILLLFILPCLLILIFIKNTQKWIFIFILFTPLLGGLLWLVLLPKHRMHVPHFEQSLYQGMLPMLLIMLSHPVILEFLKKQGLLFWKFFRK